MTKVKAADVKKIREATGAGMLDCKKALEECEGNWDKSLSWLRDKGLARAGAKADRKTNEGFIANYVHTNGKIGALVEFLCETDFVARSEEFRNLAREIAMQVAALAPENKEELLAGEMIKNPEITVEQAIKSLSGKIGENMTVGGFERLTVGG
jgi:elongation factor Ts